MTWTYSNDPTNVERDAVRLLIGDTDTNDQQLTDEEIAYYIAQEADVRLAAARAAEGLAAQYARKVDKSVGDLSLSYSQRQTHYLELAKRLRAEGAQSAVSPFAGGISKTDKDTREADTDRVEPTFRRGMHDNPVVDPADIEDELANL